MSLFGQEAKEPPVKITKETHPFLWSVIHQKLEPIKINTIACGEPICVLIRPTRPFMERVDISTWRFNMADR
jgi:hypothetical protein